MAIEEVAAFAGRHNLSRLDGAHLARMRELVAPVAAFGAGVQRVADKHQGPYQESFSARFDTPHPGAVDTNH